MFFTTFFNRFAGIRSGGGEFSGGMALLKHFLPYRDYFTAGPPFNALKASVLLDLAGHKLFALRIFAVVERMVLGSILLVWLGQAVPARHAYIGSFVTIALSVGDRTDPLASYNHDALLFAVAGGLLASGALRRGLGGAAFALAAFGSGACAALSLVTKQTVGGSVSAVLLVVPLSLLFRSGVARSALYATAYMLGAAVPVAAMGLVLEHLGILHTALKMMFITGPSAKAGGAGDFIFRWGMVASDNAGWVVLGIFWWVLAGVFVRRACRSRPQPAQANEWPGARWLAWSVAAGGALVAGAEMLSRLPALHDLTKSVVYATVLGVGSVLLWSTGRVRRRDRSIEDERRFLLAAVSAATALSLSLSWPAFEAMLVPGLGLVVALLLAGSPRRAQAWIYGVLAFLVFMQLREKLDLPFGFDLQDEAPVYQATERSTLPELAGMRLPRSTVRFVDETTALIQSHTCPGDPVFTYPEMGLLYTLSDRRAPTWSPSHNIDVVNDALAQEDAARLAAARPLVLVTYREAEGDWKGAERLWRRGHRSGQRKIAAVVEALAASYRLVGTYVLREGDPPIEVYLRPDATLRRAQMCRAAQ